MSYAFEIRLLEHKYMALESYVLDRENQLSTSIENLLIAEMNYLQEKIKMLANDKRRANNG